MADDLVVDPGNHFRGESDHSLDGKGRLNIPTRFREVLRAQYDERLMITRWDDCLKAYPVLQWEKMENQLQANIQSHPDMKKVIRIIIGGVIECPLDKQGRILLPPKLREEGGISKEVTIIGMMTYFEIINKQTWEADKKLSKDEIKSVEASMLKSGFML